MHSSNSDEPLPRLGGAETLVAIAALVTEGRMPSPVGPPLKQPAASLGFSEGPHCTFSKAAQGHICNLDNQLCIKYEKINAYVVSLWQKNIPLCIQVLLVPKCCAPSDLLLNSASGIEQIGSAVLLEEWHINVIHRRAHDLTNLNINQLINAIRSQLYFSQITAWLASPDEKIRKSFPNNNVIYCLTIPGETYGCKKFSTTAQKHNFPLADIGNGIVLKVSLSNLPRTEEIPQIQCSKCIPESNYLDDRLQTSCTLKGKHHCTDYEEFENTCRHTRLKQDILDTPSTSKEYKPTNKNKGDILLDAILRTSTKTEKNTVFLERNKRKCVHRNIQNNLINKNSVINHLTQNSSVLQHLKQPNSENSILNQLSKIALNHSPSIDKFRSKNYVPNQPECSNMEVNHINDSPLLHQQPTTSMEQHIEDVVMNPVQNNPKRPDFQSRQTNIVLSQTNHMLAPKTLCDESCDNKVSDNNCDSLKRKKTECKMRDISNVFSLEYLEKRQKVKVKQKITFDDADSKNDDETSKYRKITVEERCEDVEKRNACGIPSASDQAKFRKNLDSAASMVFHSRTGLPLTSSPAPVRRGKNCFDFDSSINSVSAIRSALFSMAPSCSTDDDSESDCSIVSPCSPDNITSLRPCKVSPYYYHRRGQSAGLLGSFEESVLNGRLEPVSTVHGFTAELGASGSFCPRHVVLPVTVFFYTLGDNDKVSTPYLGHINLGKKGYNVPKSGTIQVTLFNPLGTVVKMFVIMYDLSDMPVSSQTFIRQRTLYMPANVSSSHAQWNHNWLRYLVHLRFMSSKSGRIYLHSDIRMIICRKSDLDTATAHGIDMSYELRSFTHCPTNPKFSPRK